MRRLTWMAVGALAGTGGRRWVVGRIRRSVAASAGGTRPARGAVGGAGSREAAGGAGVAVGTGGAAGIRMGGGGAGVGTGGAAGIRMGGGGVGTGGDAGRRMGGGGDGAKSVRGLAEAAVPVVGVAATAGAAAGRGVARLAGLGARRMRVRVRHAVDGGRSDARAREDELRRVWDQPARPGGPVRLAGPGSGGSQPHGRRLTGR